MKGKRILITGVAGSIGSELARQLCKKNKVYGVDINESGLFDIMQELGISGRVGNVKDQNTVRDVFSDFKPQVVFMAAAYKHVSLMEQVPEEGVKTNVFGTHNVLHYSKVYPVEKFVFISTDKAIGGTTMGATKRLGEIMTRNSGKGFVVVRFGNVLGSRGSLMTIWQRQLDQGKPLTITDGRMERYMMTIEEACELVITAAEQGRGGETYVLDMGEKHNILGLAKEILGKIGKPDYPIQEIGIRPGEQLSEKLMFEEEEARAVKQGKFFIIK